MCDSNVQRAMRGGVVHSPHAPDRSVVGGSHNGAKSAVAFFMYEVFFNSETFQHQLDTWS
jgi:hypothetical protein